MGRSGEAGFRGWWAFLALWLCFYLSIYVGLGSGGVVILGFYRREDASVMP